MSRTPLADLVDRARAPHATFDQHVIDIVDRITSPGRLAIAFRHRARHIGPWHTPLGALAPTGRTVTELGIDPLTLTGNRISRIRVLADELQRLMRIRPHPPADESPVPPLHTTATATPPKPSEPCSSTCSPTKASTGYQRNATPAPPDCSTDPASAKKDTAAPTPGSRTNGPRPPLRTPRR